MTRRDAVSQVSVARVGVRVPLALGRVAAIVRRVLRAERARAHIDVSFVTARALTRVHAAAFGSAKVTDIVTLQHRASAPTLTRVGEVYIAPAVARANARRWKRPVREEIARLTIHGVLHALGWDHPDAGREGSPMWRRQESLLRACQRVGLA
jgi:probable rRNA maturation factor